MQQAEIAEALQRETAAWNAHDADGVAACYAEDAELTDVGFPDPTIHGRAAIRDVAAGYMAAFSDLHLDAQQPVVSGNRAAQEWTVTGTNDGELMGMPATGRRATTIGCGTAEFGDDGLIHRAGNYWNAASLMQQLGMMPEAASATP